MTEPNLVYMADILLPTAIDANMYPWQYVVFTFLALGIFVSLWIAYKKPLNTLTRQLKLGKQSPREIAHQLAQLITKDCDLSIKLDQLRFARINPDKESLLAIIYQLKKGEHIASPLRFKSDTQIP